MKKTSFQLLLLLTLSSAVALLSGCNYDLNQSANFEILPEAVPLDATFLQVLPDGGFKLELEENCEIPAQVRTLVNSLMDGVANQDIDLGAYAALPFIKPKIKVKAMYIDQIDLNAVSNTFAGIESLSFEIKDSTRNQSIYFKSEEVTDTLIPMKSQEKLDWLTFLLSPEMECMESSLAFEGTAPEKTVSFKARAYVTIKVRISLF